MEAALFARVPLILPRCVAPHLCDCLHVYIYNNAVFSCACTCVCVTFAGNDCFMIFFSPEYLQAVRAKFGEMVRRGCGKKVCCAHVCMCLCVWFTLSVDEVIILRAYNSISS